MMGYNKSRSARSTLRLSTGDQIQMAYSDPHKHPRKTKQGEIARSVRFGKHSDRLRVVIDLADGEFEVPTIKETSKELIVTIRKAPHSQISN